MLFTVLLNKRRNASFEADDICDLAKIPFTTIKRMPSNQEGSEKVTVSQHV